MVEFKVFDAIELLTLDDDRIADFGTGRRGKGMFARLKIKTSRLPGVGENFNTKFDLNKKKATIMMDK